MYSQRDEEIYILKFFRKVKGTFLDIGAYDGKTFSTTYPLVLKGWAGVCVEPSPSVFSVLQKFYQDNPNITTLQYAVTNKTGKVVFYDSGGDLISTISKAHVELWRKKAGVRFRKIEVDSLSVTDLFNLVGYDFDFINLDVEGTNLSVLSQFPFGKLKKMKMLCVEFDHQADEMIEMTKPYGYTLYHKTSENLILVR